MLSTLTASASATLDYALPAAGTYSRLDFELFHLLPATNTQVFRVRVSTDSGSSYATTSYQFIATTINSATAVASSITTTGMDLTNIVTIENTKRASAACCTWSAVPPMSAPTLPSTAAP